MLQYRQTSFSLSENTQGKSEDQAKRRSELFFMLKPDAAQCDAMHEVASRLARAYGKGKAHPPGLIHLSLLNVGYYAQPPYGLARRIGDAVGNITARPVEVRLDRSALFGNSRHLVLTSSRRNPGLQAFVRRLHATLTRHNLPRGAIRSASPHVTLIYGYRGKQLPVLEKEYIWLSRDFSLVYSHNGEARHEELGRWRLDADASPYALPLEQLRLFS